jgi:alpha-ketoglutarate-dependent taurine dioxygenase
MSTTTTMTPAATQRPPTELSDPRLEQWRQSLARDGYLYIDDLPSDVDHYQFAQNFGKLLPQYDGRTLWSIKADPKFDDTYHSLNTKALFPHTECYEFAGLPPRYLALWCVTPAGCGGGLTTLFDAWAYFQGLPPAVREKLTGRQFRFRSSTGIQKSGLERSALHPFWETAPLGNPLVRFSANNVDFEDQDDVRDAAQGMVKKFDENCWSFRWSPGAFLIWDNHRVVHSRTKYTDRARELRRVWLADWDSSGDCDTVMT